MRRIRFFGFALPKCDYYTDRQFEILFLRNNNDIKGNGFLLDTQDWPITYL